MPLMAFAMLALTLRSSFIYSCVLSQLTAGPFDLAELSVIERSA